jgi:hypothetical protein
VYGTSANRDPFSRWRDATWNSNPFAGRAALAISSALVFVYAQSSTIPTTGP